MIAPADQLGGKHITLGTIETSCRDYENSTAALEELISALETDLEEVKRKHLRGLKRQAAIVANIEADLRNQIERAPELFTKPRTLTIHGVKVGFTVSNGRVEWEDEDLVLKKIKKHFPDDTDVLIRTTEEPNKDAIRVLTPAGLEKIGCTIEGVGDVVLVKRVAGDIEKLIDKLKTKLVEAMVSEE